MSPEILKERNFNLEFIFTASRSSGPGGQHVNKVSTKIELRFSVLNSNLLTPEEREILLTRLASKLTAGGEIVITSQSERSQLQNKEKVIEKFFALISKALTPVKKRKPTKPSKAAKEKRLQEKRMLSEKKERRKNE
jgi:ribosome-associated protein